MTSRTAALAVEYVTCPRCGAAPGHRCLTKSGFTATYAHARRTDVAYAAWRIGYAEGRRDAGDVLARDAGRWPAQNSYAGSAIATWIREHWVTQESALLAD